MEEKNNQNSVNNDLVKAANFVLLKFLSQAGVIQAKGKILEKEFYNLKKRVQMKKINSIIQKYN